MNRGVLIVGLVLGWAGLAAATIALWGGGEKRNFGDEFDRLEQRLIEAQEEFAERSAENPGGGDPSMPDARLAIFESIDKMADAAVESPEGGRIANQAFYWSWMLDFDLPRLHDRFDRIVKHHPDSPETSQTLSLVPNAYRASKTREEWFRSLRALARKSSLPSVRDDALHALGRLGMTSRQQEVAKEAFAKLAEVTSNEELRELASGYLFELEHLQVGMPAPDFTTKTLDGESVSLSDYRGKVVLLDFWATWCAPCIGEIPHLKEAAKTFDEERFVILGVSLDSDPGQLRQTVAAFQIPGIQTWEDTGRDNPVAKTYNAQLLPTWYVLDKGGIIRARDPFGARLLPVIEEAMKIAQTP